MYVRGVAVVSIDIDIDIECCVFALFALFASCSTQYSAALRCW